MQHLRETVVTTIVALTALAAQAQQPGRADERNLWLSTPGVMRVVSAQARSGSVATPEHLVDGDPATEFVFQWGNGGASAVIDLGRPCVIEKLRVTNGRTDPLIWVDRVHVGPDSEHLRDILGRRVNLAINPPGQSTDIPLPPSVGRYIKVRFSGGGSEGRIAEVDVFGRPNFPERHLMCWWGDLQEDIIDKLDYFDKELGATDLWLDYTATAFPQSNRNSGFKVWEDAGVFAELRQRGIRYWLAEHEAFAQMVNAPEDLRNDQAWETTMLLARKVYAQARDLGFRGLVLDAEDYNGVTKEAAEKYGDRADHVDAWAFYDEFGYSGYYYQRGLQYGRILKQVWDCPLIQVYEARMYAGGGDHRAGNYWWLKGIHDAGIEVWVATERTYGAGDGEMSPTNPVPPWYRWFVQTPEYITKAHEAYPFAARILPGFWPWDTSQGQPHYLPKYLDEQLTIAEGLTPAYWIYTQGLRHGGDPREVLDEETLKKHGVTAQDYLNVFMRHATSRQH